MKKSYESLRKDETVPSGLTGDDFMQVKNAPRPKTARKKNTAIPRLYSAGLRSGTDKTVSDLVRRIVEVKGTIVVTRGAATVQFRADLATKTEVCRVLRGIGVVGASVKLSPAK